MMLVQSGQVKGMISEVVLFELAMQFFQKELNKPATALSNNIHEQREYFGALLTGWKNIFIKYGFEILPYLPKNGEQYQIQDVIDDPRSFFKHDPSRKKNDRKDAAIFCGALNHLNSEDTLVFTNESTEHLGGEFKDAGFKVFNLEKYAESKGLKKGKDGGKGVELKFDNIRNLMDKKNFYYIDQLLLDELSAASPEYAKYFMVKDFVDSPKVSSEQLNEFIQNDGVLKRKILSFCFFYEDSLNKDELIDLITTKTGESIEIIRLNIQLMIEGGLVKQIGQYCLPNFEDQSIALSVLSDIENLLEEDE